MTHVYVFWLKDNLGDIIPVRDLKLTSQQTEIRDEIGGLGHVVGTIVKARFGEGYYDAKVLKIGSNKELSEAEETLIAAERELKFEKKRRIRPPNRYGDSQESSDSEDGRNKFVTENKKKKSSQLKEAESIKNKNKTSSFMDIIGRYNMKVSTNAEDIEKLYSAENMKIDETEQVECSLDLEREDTSMSVSLLQNKENCAPDKYMIDETEQVECSLELEREDTSDSISLLPDNKSCALDKNMIDETKQDECYLELSCVPDDFHNWSHAELVEEVLKLRGQVSQLESQPVGCPRSTEQKPPLVVQQYLRSLLDCSDTEAVIKENAFTSTNKVPLIDGSCLMVTKAQKLGIIIEGRNNPRAMVSNFLRVFHSEEELSKLSYHGRNENPALSEEYKECLSGLLMKYHPTFVQVAGTVNRICANSRSRWKAKTGQQRPGDDSKFTPKVKRQKKKM